MLWACAQSIEIISAPALSNAIALSKSKGPVAAATSNLPSLSLAAFACFLWFNISRIVTIPTSLLSLKTGSLSTLFSYAISSASSAEVDSSIVTTSEVIISLTNLSWPDLIIGLTSLRLIIPIISSPSTTGKPLIDISSITFWTSLTEESGLIVITSLIVISSAFLTFLTSSTSCSKVLFLWITPIPPSWAS